MNEKINTSQKILRTFVIHSNIFFQFKAETIRRKQTLSNATEQLLIYYLNNPKLFNQNK